MISRFPVNLKYKSSVKTSSQIKVATAIRFFVKVGRIKDDKVRFFRTTGSVQPCFCATWAIVKPWDNLKGTRKSPFREFGSVAIFPK